MKNLIFVWYFYWAFSATQLTEFLNHCQHPKTVKVVGEMGPASEAVYLILYEGDKGATAKVGNRWETDIPVQGERQ